MCVVSWWSVGAKVRCVGWSGRRRAAWVGAGEGALRRSERAKVRCVGRSGRRRAAWGRGACRCLPLLRRGALRCSGPWPHGATHCAPVGRSVRTRRRESEERSALRAPAKDPALLGCAQARAPAPRSAPSPGRWLTAERLHHRSSATTAFALAGAMSGMSLMAAGCEPMAVLRLCQCAFASRRSSSIGPQAGSSHEPTVTRSGRWWPAAGDFCGAEQRSLGLGARSALRSSDSRRLARAERPQGAQRVAPCQPKASSTGKSTRRADRRSYRPPPATACRSTPGSGTPASQPATTCHSTRSLGMPASQPATARRSTPGAGMYAPEKTRSPLQVGRFAHMKAIDPAAAISASSVKPAR